MDAQVSRATFASLDVLKKVVTEKRLERVNGDRKC